jgi:hypothetical protein
VPFLRRLFKAINEFVTTAYKKPLWILITFFWVSSVTFITSYQSVALDAQAKLASVDNEIAVLREDGERLLTLHNGAISDYEAAEKTSDLFLSVLDAINSEQAISRNRVEETYKQIVQVREKIEERLMTLKGSRFVLPIHNERVDAIAGILATKVNTLKIMEDILSAYLNNNYDNHLRQLLDSSIISANKNGAETSIAFMESNILKAQSEFRVKKIELDKLRAQAERDIRIGYLQYPAFLYCIGYVIAVCMGIRNSLRKFHVMNSRKMPAGYSADKVKRSRRKP